MIAASEMIIDDVDSVGLLEPVSDADGASSNAPEIAKRRGTAANAILSVVDQAVVSGTNFITIVIIGRMCTKHDLGIYSLAFSVLLLIRGIQYQVINAPYMIYWSRRSQSDRGVYLGSSVVHQIALTALAVVGLIGQLILLWNGVGPPGLVPVVWVLVAGIPFLLFREFLRNLALAHLRMVDAIAIDATVAAVQLGVMAALAFFELLTIPAVYATTALACGLACLGWRIGRQETLQFARKRIVSDWSGNWCFGKWALWSHLAGGSIPYIMPWIVAAAHGEADTGVLAAASTLVGLSNTFVIGLGNFLTPRAALAFSKEGIRSLARVLAGFAIVFAVALGAFCVLIACFGDPLAVLIYGDRYRGIGTIIMLLALTVLANSLRMTAGSGLWSMERPRANFLADIVTLLVTLSVTAACVGPFGVLGAAIGMLSGAIAGAVTGAVLLMRIFRLFGPKPEAG